MLRLARSLAGLLAWQGVLGYWRVRLVAQKVRQDARNRAVSAWRAESTPVGTGAELGAQEAAQQRERRSRALDEIALTQDPHDTNETVRTR